MSYSKWIPANQNTKKKTYIVILLLKLKLLIYWSPKHSLMNYWWHRLLNSYTTYFVGNFVFLQYYQQPNWTIGVDIILAINCMQFLVLYKQKYTSIYTSGSVYIGKILLENWYFTVQFWSAPFVSCSIYDFDLLMKTCIMYWKVINKASL